MPSPPDIVRRKLLRRGLPAGYVDRLAEELADHWSDALQDGLGAGLSPHEAYERAGQRLGAPDDLADAAARAYRRRTPLGRHAAVAVVVLPVVAVPLLWAAFLSVVVGGGLYVLDWAGVPDRSRLTAGLLRAACHLASHGVGPVVAVSVYRAGRAGALGDAWTWTACGLAALVASFPHASVIVPSAAVPSGRLVIGLLRVPSVTKFFLPVAVVVLHEIFWRVRRVTLLNA